MSFKLFDDAVMKAVAVAVEKSPVIESIVRTVETVVTSLSATLSAMKAVNKRLDTLEKVVDVQNQALEGIATLLFEPPKQTSGSSTDTALPPIDDTIKIDKPN
jgi:hypothetical protein